MEYFKQAIFLKKDAYYYFNLGNSFKELHMLDEAVDNYTLAINLEPDHPIINFNLGMVLRKLGLIQGATKVFRHIASLNPLDSESLLNLGSILAEQNKDDEAIEFYKKILTIDSTHQDALHSMASVLSKQSRIEEAKQVSNQLLNSHPSDAFKVQALFQIPIIAPSTQVILDWRNQFLSNINELIKSDIKLNDPLVEVGTTNFYFAFQGLDNFELNSKVAKLMTTACPSLTWVSPHCLKKCERKNKTHIRVGFISNFFHLHSIGKTSRGVISELDRNRFEVYTLFAPPIVDDLISQSIQNSADYFHILPEGINEARKIISELKLDILYYQDIGMDAFTYYLAFSRLAPVQCVSFGHPDTTGIDTIDYFVSTELFETPDSKEQYSEKLIKLQNIATPAYYYHPDFNTDEAKKRCFFGISDHSNIYFCPQTLFKFHPEFDFILADILNVDSQGIIICLEAHISHWTELLKQRFQEVIGINTNRILFLPRQKYCDYLNLLAISDVVLDTIHFNGMNTTLEAFSVGTPVITLPSQFQRGRHTSAMYRKMEIEECIAYDPADYAKRATQLATDKELRSIISNKIINRSTEIFMEKKVITQWEEFFIDAFKKSKK